MKQLYKFLRTGLKSHHGDFQWQLKQWEKIDGCLDICKVGFHGSERAIDALGYISGEILALTQVRGVHIDSSDKQAWSEMCIVKAWNWTKADSVALSIFSAEIVIDIYEKKYPNDDRPRKAIEAAKAYLENPTGAAAYDASGAAARAAARAASGAARAASGAARAASGAAYAAYAAAYAAGAAARAASGAARAASGAAYAAYGAAAYAAGAAAYDAPGAAALGKIEAWVQKHIATLEPWSE